MKQSATMKTPQSNHKDNFISIIMARRVIPMIVFPRVRTIYMYIFLCHLSEYALYIYVVRKLRHSGGLGQLMGVACNRTRA